MVTSRFKINFFIGCLSFALSACGNTDILLEPTGRAASVPGDEVEFTQYVADSRKNIEQILDELRPESEKRPYLGDYTNKQVAELRGPFQVPEEDSERCDDASKGGAKGFLLIHGLTDSPYLMRSIRDTLHKEYSCALIRAVLLPGHGTVAGDSLKMEYQDWMRITDYGVSGFKKDKKVTDLYLVGFSTGASLAIKYMKENPVNSGELREDKIKGLILVSTAVKAKSRIAWLAPIMKGIKTWSGKFAERDAVRHESFSLHAGAQFYELTKGMVDPEYALDVPVLMAVSADDDTIDAKAAREFFCYPTKVKRRALIWYQSIDPKVNADINSRKTPELMCENIVEIELGDINPKYKTVNLAHTALSMNPEDAHYGVNGKYHNCKAYDSDIKVMSEEFINCQGDKKNNIFGENNIADLKDRLGYDYWRRGTFNPDYINLEKRILCFTNDDCATGDFLSLSQ